MEGGKKISAADVAGKCVVSTVLAVLICCMYFKGGEDRKVSLQEKFCSKNFFLLELEGKRKTQNQYAEIINVYANESLTKKTRKIKGTQMNFNGHVL